MPEKNKILMSKTIRFFHFVSIRRKRYQELNMKKETFPPLMAGTVQAGFPSPAEHYVERELDLNDYLAANRDAVYYVRVKGESMIGANIFPGDILCVDRSVDFFDGAIIVASIDGDFTVKYLRKNGRTAFLEPATANFKPIYFTPGQDVRFWGVVTGIVRKVNYSRTRQAISEPEAAPQHIISSSNPGIRLNGTREKYKEKLGGK